MKTNISIYLWFKLVIGLKHRGQGKRESGGLLLHKDGSNKICQVVFYDMFDKTVSENGIIEFKGSALLYEYLAKNNLLIFADIHTHPTSNTQQSQSDKEHPIVRIKGHIAIIAPSFAQKRFLMPSDCSMYKYLGEFKWGELNNTLNLKLI